MQLTIFYTEDDISYMRRYKTQFLKVMKIEEYNEKLLQLEVYLLYKRLYNINVKEEL